jgi:threonylcarbamoyladenosine tRNA methylthiotransferase MtaB
MATFLLVTLGCKMNTYETLALKEGLLKQGYREAGASEKPDFVVVNTCAVTAMAERKDLKTVRDLARDYPKSCLYIMGCSSQIHKDAYLSFPQVKGVFGTDQRQRIPTLMGQDVGDRVNPDFHHFCWDPLALSQGEYPAKAYLKIQDGCNNYCAYCLVPYTRGVSRSRPKEEILAEAKRLILNGYKEIIIGGIDVGSFQDPEDPHYRLAQLLEEIVLLCPERDFRIRVSSIEASQIDESYIQVFKDHPDRLCPHFHIPLQSGSQKILTAMGRKYSKAAYLTMVQKVKEALPGVALSTDIITGFPGESDEDFQETVTFAKTIGYMRIHAFPYSERPLTRASLINEGKVPMGVRKSRTQELIRLSGELDQAFRKEHAGQKARLLVEAPVRPGVYSGYTENYLEMTLTSSRNLTATFVPVIIH